MCVSDFMKEVRKWIVIAVERSTTMRRHRATFVKAVVETRTAKSFEASQDEKQLLGNQQEDGTPLGSEDDRHGDSGSKASKTNA